ncbi:hypothetical protein [Mycobacterium sp. MMS18-G62]
MGACSVFGVSSTAAACDRFDDDDGATPEVRLLVADVGLALEVGDSLRAELGGTKAAEGDTALADTLALADTFADSLLVAVAVAVSGARLAGLGGADVTAAAVDEAGAGSLVEVVATRGAGGSAVVAGGLATVVGVATVDGATTAAVLVCTGDGGGACVWVGVWGWGASTLGAVCTGGLGGASCVGASATVGCSGATTSGSGAGTVVVGTTGSVCGLAYAGAMPPVSAVREMTTPDTSPATTVRR